MNFPALGSIALVGPAGATCAGAAFELFRAARESESVSVDGWHVDVCGGKKLVVARGGVEDNYDDAFRSGLLFAQKGLDLMSLRGGNNIVIEGFDDDHVVWWPEASGLVVRTVSIAPVSIDVPPATAIVTDPSGNVVPQPAPPPVVWHESFRYFRLSQTSDDLFDAYRNAYLALESALSSIAPQHTNAAGKVTEREGTWFRRALTAADQITPLAPFVPTGTPDPVQHLYDELYVDMRSAMSHAKSGRKILLPQDEAQRQAVTRSLVRLVELYLRVAEAHLGARRLSGGMFAGAFRMMHAPFFESMTVTVSDDESPIDPGSVPHPSDAARPLTASAAADTTTSFLVTRLWAAPGSDLAGIPFVRRTVATHDGEPAIGGDLQDRLILGTTQRLEVMLGVRGTNARQPRERYSF